MNEEKLTSEQALEEIEKIMLEELRFYANKENNISA